MDEKDEIIISRDLIEEAIIYSESNEFLSQINDFESKYDYLFEPLVESKHPEEDIPLEFQTVFIQFQSLIEVLFSDFALRCKCTPQEFFENCRDCLEGRFLPLFEEEHKNRWFVELLLSWTSFNNFMERMLKRIRNRKYK